MLRKPMLDAFRCHIPFRRDTGGTLTIIEDILLLALPFGFLASHSFFLIFLSETNKDVDRKLPDFPRLVNFPDYLSRGQTRSGDGANSTVEGKRHCVMCGQLRVCSKTANRANQKSVTTSNASSDKDTDSTAHIIPRQNKGVCTACDVAVWVMVSQDGLEIKWCKGCKNFRPWAAFGEKGLATKCVRCRHRQREKYASQKNELRRQQRAN